MSQDQSIPRRNKIDGHMANDDPILTTMRFIPQHEVVQRYGAVLLEYLTNQAMKESKTKQAPKPSLGKRVKATTKVAKSGKKKQLALGLETLSEVALTEAEQLKLATKRSLIQTHSSYANGSGAHEGTGVTPGVLDVPKYGSDDEQISWKSSDEEDDDDDEANVGKDEDDDDHDDDDERTKSDNDGEDFVHPKFSTHDDEASSMCIEEEKMDEETTHEKNKANELYRDVNVNLEVRDTEMIDAPIPNVQGTQVIKDTHVIITTLVNPEAVSSIPGIVDAYLAKKMNESVKTTVQLQPDRLRDAAQAENEDFFNSLDDNIKKIIKDQVKQQVKAQVSKILPRIEKTINEQLEAEVMTRSSNESNTSHTIAANLSELELKKILIDKMESNKDDEDKDEEPSAGSNRGSKKRRVGKEPESTSALKEKTSKSFGKSYEGSKSQHKTAKESAHTDEPMHTTKDLEQPAHQEFKTGVTKDQPNEETLQFPDWFQR
ncbi:hypothetical protein Tco_0987368 [Tanacetum coccineum]